MVCRDCGEVTHYDAGVVATGRLVACGACGLVADPKAMRAPLADPARPARAPPGPPPRHAGARRP